MLATLRHRNFALVWLGGLISLLGDWTLRIALPFYIFEVTGSVLATGVMVMVSTIPRVALGPVAGVFVDRWDRKHTLVIANILLCLLLLLLLLVRSAEQVWLVFVVAFLESSIAQFISPAEHALLPRLVPETHLVPANALNALNNNLAMLTGPAISGALMAAFGLRIVVMLDSLSYLIAAMLMWLVAQPPRTAQPSDPVVISPARGLSAAWTTMWREWWDGTQLVKTNRACCRLPGNGHRCAWRTQPPMHECLTGLVRCFQEVQQFWQQHARIRTCSEQEIEVDGMAALVFRFESIPTVAHLDVVVARDTFRLLQVHGSPPCKQARE
jgi:MFS family permease